MSCCDWLRESGGNKSPVRFKPLLGAPIDVGVEDLRGWDGLDGTEVAGVVTGVKGVKGVAGVLAEEGRSEDATALAFLREVDLAGEVSRWDLERSALAFELEVEAEDRALAAVRGVLGVSGDPLLKGVVGVKGVLGVLGIGGVSGVTGVNGVGGVVGLCGVVGDRSSSNFTPCSR